MKKTGISLALICIIICLLGACGRKTETTGSERIFSHRYAESCTIGDNIYYLQTDSAMNQCVCYYDNQSGAYGPLCGKPECTHNSPECCAFLGQARGFGAVGNQLYWIATDYSDGGIYVNRMDSTGNGHKKIRKISEVGNDVLPTGNVQVLYDAQYMYMCGQSGIIKDGEEILFARMMRFPLEGDGYELLYEKEGTGIPLMQIYQNQLYLANVDRTIDPETGLYINTAELDFRRFDIQTLEEKQLYTGTIDFPLYEFYVMEDKILMTAVDSSDNQVFSYDFSSQSIQPAFVFSEEDEYEPLFLDDDRVIGYAYPHYPDFSEKKLRVTDFRGNEIMDIVNHESQYSEENGRPFGRIYYGCDGGGLYFYYQDFSHPEEIIHRVIRYDVKDGTETVLSESHIK